MSVCVCVMSGEAWALGTWEVSVLRNNTWVPSGTLGTNFGSRYIKPGGYGGTYHMFTPARAFYSRQTMILPVIFWLRMKEAMPGEERKEKKRAPVKGRNVSAQEIKNWQHVFFISSLPPSLPLHLLDH